MSFPWAPALLALYYSVLAVLSFFGLHRLMLVDDVPAHPGRRPVPPPELPADPQAWPVVTVQLPLYNEMYVAERLIDAVCRLDYPAGRLEIQVLDDSTDETTRDRRPRRGRATGPRGVDIHHLHRADRTGFKAGALAAGLAQARGELLAIFDADFVPAPDFLRAAVPHFADPGLGMVQGSWDHINRAYSLLTRVEAILLDGHFMIEHTARNRSGCFFNFNGTAGIWRREAIDDRRRLGARHADRGPRPLLPRPARGVAVPLPARARRPLRAAGRRQRLQEPAVPLGQGGGADRPQAAGARSSGPRSP